MNTKSSPANADAVDDVHLIVAKDEEVVIEHHPEDWMAFVLFWGLAFIVFLQFFTRYILNDSLSWTEEIARYGLMSRSSAAQWSRARRRISQSNWCRT